MRIFKRFDIAWTTACLDMTILRHNFYVIFVYGAIAAFVRSFVRFLPSLFCVRTLLPPLPFWFPFSSFWRKPHFVVQTQLWIYWLLRLNCIDNVYTSLKIHFSRWFFCTIFFIISILDDCSELNWTELNRIDVFFPRSVAFTSANSHSQIRFSYDRIKMEKKPEQKNNHEIAIAVVNGIVWNGERDHILNACHQELSAICPGLIQMTVGKKEVFISAKSYAQHIAESAFFCVWPWWCCCYWCCFCCCYVERFQSVVVFNFIDTENHFSIICLSHWRNTRARCIIWPQRRQWRHNTINC